MNAPINIPPQATKLEQMANRVQTRDDFIRFVRELNEDRNSASREWGNDDLPKYLDAVAAWTEDMDGYFLNNGQPVPQQPDWKLFATILFAARVYE